MHKEEYTEKKRKPGEGLEWLLPVVLLLLALITVKDAQRNGDFIGYLNAGNLVLNGEDIYSDYLNTWPPFFSVVSVPLALMDKGSPVGVRLFWLLGSWGALFLLMRMALKLFAGKTLLLPFQKKVKDTQLSFVHPLSFIPLLLSLRFLMDNSSHLQINLYMLVLAFGSVYFFYRSKVIPAALLLGFSVAIKVFTVFLLLYFFYKRAWRMGLLSVFFVLLFSGSTVLIFGLEGAIRYHEAWFVKSVLPLPDPHHMNQSLMAAFIRLLSEQATGIDFRINFLSLAPSSIKAVYYGSLLLAAAFPLYAFRQKICPRQISLGQLMQWGILFALIPILSPVAWKPYFVFLWIPFFVLYFLVFHLRIARAQLVKVLFYASLPFLILSSELFAGVYFSDVLEVCNFITLGALLLAGALASLYFSLGGERLRQPITELWHP